jgi:hypothetical protein
MSDTGVLYVDFTYLILEKVSFTEVSTSKHEQSFS